MEILCFLAGVMCFYFKSLVLLFVPLLALFLQAGRGVVVWFAAALVWSFIHQQWVNDSNLPDALVIQRAFITGQIASIPVENADKTQFEFKLDQFNLQPARALLLLNCYQQCSAFQVGQRWQFEVKLKRPQNLANPGHFAYMERLQARHIHWTGTIQNRNRRCLMESNHGGGLLSMREQLGFGLVQRLQGKASAAIAEALSVGIANQISVEQWGLFRRTGTTHLMVISGAHIGLVAGLAFFLMKWVWSRSARLCLLYPSLRVGSLAGLLMAVLYTLLAGFSVSAQRGMLAAGFMLIRYLIPYRFTGWQSWRYALLLVLLYEPHAVLLPGFYLSFLTVAILIGMGARISATGFKKNLLLQFACMTGLMPLTLYWFSYGALDGFFANMIAIPLVSYVIVPLALFGLILTSFQPAASLFTLLDWSIEALLRFLQAVDSLSWMNLQLALTRIESVLALMLALVVTVLLPIRSGWPATLTLVICSLFPHYSRPKVGEAWINVLDVGQGLSVVVETAGHQLVYDTGGKFFHGGDMGQLAVLPFLQTRGIHHLDKVIISHPDLDHRGGLASLEEKLAIDQLLVNDVAFYQRGLNCHQIPAWEWDGVQFHFFPILEPTFNRNNASCVLQISTPAGSVLLPGDIEKPAEKYLVQHYGNQLHSSVLVTPHHGSKTSSTPAFIEQVAPAYAIIAAALDNRYHFPHPTSLATYAAAGSQVLNTASCGMVTVVLPAGKKGVLTHCYNYSSDR